MCRGAGPPPRGRHPRPEGLGHRAWRQAEPAEARVSRHRFRSVICPQELCTLASTLQMRTLSREALVANARGWSGVGWDLTPGGLARSPDPQRDPEPLCQGSRHGGVGPCPWSGPLWGGHAALRQTHRVSVPPSLYSRGPTALTWSEPVSSRASVGPQQPPPPRLPSPPLTRFVAGDRSKEAPSWPVPSVGQ